MRIRPPRTTHTYALLPISAAAYAEIREKLQQAGYDHQINHPGPGQAYEALDMHGLALVREESEVPQ